MYIYIYVYIFVYIHTHTHVQITDMRRNTFVLMYLHTCIHAYISCIPSTRGFFTRSWSVSIVVLAQLEGLKLEPLKVQRWVLKTCYAGPIYVCPKQENDVHIGGCTGRDVQGCNLSGRGLVLRGVCKDM